MGAARGHAENELTAELDAVRNNYAIRTRATGEAPRQAHGTRHRSPEPQMMTGAPLVYQLHAIGGFLFLGLWPFTRLVHVWSAPLAYLWRPYVVYRARRGKPVTPAPTPTAVRDRTLHDARY